MRKIRVLILCAGIILTAAGFVTAQEPQTKSRKFDEFTGPNWESAMAHLDNFALDLQNKPKVFGVLLIYGGQHGMMGESKAWSTCVKDYLVARRGIPVDRVIMINGGYRQNLTAELWEASDKNDLPKPDPHIRADDVGFRKGKVKNMCNL